MGLLDGRTEPPDVRGASLTTPYRLRGQDARVECEVANADDIVVEAADGQRIVVPPAGGRTSVAFRPERSGAVTLTARNRFGTVTADLGELELFELPPFEIRDVRLPRPDVPALDPVLLDDAPAVLAERPVATVGSTPVAAVPLPIVAAAVEQAPPPRRALPALPRLDEPVAHTAQAIGAGIRTAGS